jgi:hypothetical protein
MINNDDDDKAKEEKDNIEFNEININLDTNIAKNPSFVISEKKECRYCLSDDKKGNLINPCQCEGTMKYVHQNCLEEWIKNGNKTIFEINSNSNKKLFSTRCEICKYEIRFTKYYKNNLLKSIFKMLKNIFGSFKNVLNLTLHSFIVFFLIKRLRMLFQEFTCICKRYVNFMQPSFWINFIHHITVLTSILVALNDIYSFYCKMLVTKRKCLVYFLPRIQQQ